MPENQPAPTSVAPHEDTYRLSTFIEQLVEHVFISELLQEVYYRFGMTIEVLRSEIDASGYDIVFECNGFIRHVQLKTSSVDAKTSRQKVNVALAEKPSGCVVWIVRHEAANRQLRLTYRFFGNNAGQPLPSLADFPVATHTKGNKDGVKAERPAIRVVNKGQFTPIETTTELVCQLFGLTPPTPRAEATHV